MSISTFFSRGVGGGGGGGANVLRGKFLESISLCAHVQGFLSKL